jgi:hypothetical protein
MYIAINPVHVFHAFQAVVGRAVTAANHFHVFTGRLPPISLYALGQTRGTLNRPIIVEIADPRGYSGR